MDDQRPLQLPAGMQQERQLGRVSLGQPSKCAWIITTAQAHSDHRRRDEAGEKQRNTEVLVTSPITIMKIAGGTAYPSRCRMR